MASLRPQDFTLISDEFYFVRVLSKCFEGPNIMLKSVDKTNNCCLSSDPVLATNSWGSFHCSQPQPQQQPPFMFWLPRPQPPADWPALHYSVNTELQPDEWLCSPRAARGVAGLKRRSIGTFVITEKASTRAFSWLKEPTSAITFKTLTRHYAEQALAHGNDCIDNCVSYMW